MIATDDNPTLAELTKRYVLDALQRNGFNISRTARELGITRVTLYKKVKAWRAARRA